MIKTKVVAIFRTFFKFFFFPKTYLYLTFDDGPLKGSKECWELCKRLKVRATYFMVGRHAESQIGKELIDSINSSYPEYCLCNHSYSHANEMYKSFYGNPLLALSDFIKAQDILAAKRKIVRLPGYNTWMRNNVFSGPKLVAPLCEILENGGFSVFGWDIEWEIEKNNKLLFRQHVNDLKRKIISMVVRNRCHVKNHVVILVHDIAFKNQENLIALEKLISFFKENPQFQFESIDNYPGFEL